MDLNNAMEQLAHGASSVRRKNIILTKEDIVAEDWEIGPKFFSFSEAFNFLKEGKEITIFGTTNIFYMKDGKIFYKNDDGDDGDDGDDDDDDEDYRIFSFTIEQLSANNWVIVEEEIQKEKSSFLCSFSEAFSIAEKEGKTIIWNDYYFKVKHGKLIPEKIEANEYEYNPKDEIEFLVNAVNSKWFPYNQKSGKLKPLKCRGYSFLDALAITNKEGKKFARYNDSFYLQMKNGVLNCVYIESENDDEDLIDYFYDAIIGNWTVKN